MRQIFNYITLFSLLLTGCSEELIDGNARATLTGSVRMEPSNEPLANVKISTTPASITVFSDENGNFEIPENLPLGDFSVRAELKGYISEYQAITIKEFDQKVHVVFEMITDKSLNKPPTKPTLISPKNLSTDLDNAVELEWNSTDPDKDSLTYKLIFTNNRTNKRIELPHINEKKVLMSDLDFGTTYTWQIAASDSVNSEVLSEAFHFTVRQNPAYRYHFVRKSNGNYNVMATNLEEVINITGLSKQAWRPRKNNVANKLAYLQTYNGQTHLFTTDLDGYNERKISQIPINGFGNEQLGYAWKADGSQFIFPSFDKLYRINSNGTGQSLLYTTSDGHFISQCVWSNDGTKIALVSNDINGYQAKIIVLDGQGGYLQTVIQNVPGAVGGLDFDITGARLLYTHDISGNQNAQYRQLDTRIFMYSFADNSHVDVSSRSQKQIGTIDIDPMFSPDNGAIIFTSTSNDMRSQRDVYSINLNEDNSRTLLIENAEMVDLQ